MPTPEPALPANAPREIWMAATGFDAIGRWADFKLRNVVQHMRWIEPGEFWMGSTEAERRRFAAQLPEGKRNRLDDEKPRHRVTLSR